MRLSDIENLFSLFMITKICLPKLVRPLQFKSHHMIWPITLASPSIHDSTEENSLETSQPKAAAPTFKRKPVQLKHKVQTFINPEPLPRVY